MSVASAAWLALEADAPLQDGMLRRRIHQQATPHIFVALEAGTRARLFQLEVPKALSPGPRDLFDAAGFTVSLLPGDKADRVAVTVRAAGAVFSEVFTSLADDVLDVTATAQSEKGALASFLDRLRIWRFFFSRSQHDGLGLEERRGLLAELLFLERLIPIVGPLVAVDAWVGPFAKDRDFEAKTWCAEVKATTTKPPYRVMISNVRQLDPRDDERMSLSAWVLEESVGATLSLPAQVQRVRSLLTGPSSMSSVLEFDKRLMAAGYIPSHAAVYVEGYAIRSSFHFRVEGEFPRMRESAVQNGIGDIRYTLNLDACEPWQVDDVGLASRIG